MQLFKTNIDFVYLYIQDPYFYFAFDTSFVNQSNPSYKPSPIVHKHLEYAKESLLYV